VGEGNFPYQQDAAQRGILGMRPREMRDEDIGTAGERLHHVPWTVLIAIKERDDEKLYTILVETKYDNSSHRRFCAYLHVGSDVC
jgi:hypothetical protein